MRPELKEGLRDIARLDTPDLWRDVERRAKTERPEPSDVLDAPPHRSGRISRGATIAVAFAVFAAAGVFAWRALDPAEDTLMTPVDASGGYVLEFLGFGDQHEGDTVVANMRISWAGTTFPGIRECTLTALDAGGSVVGSDTRTHYVVPPATSSGFGQELRVDHDPSTVTGECGDRLDTGDPYAYDVGSPSVSAHEDTVVVTADPTWLGDGQPGFVHCRVTLTDPDANMLGERVVIEHQTLGESWRIVFEPGDLRADVASWSRDAFPVFSCIPYVGGDGTPPSASLAPLPDAVAYDYVSPPGSGYVFSDVMFRQTPTGWTTEYRVSWEQGVFPGSRACEVTLTDAAGAVLTTESWEFEALQDDRQMTLGSTEEPGAFEATCGPRLDTPVAYLISDPRLVTRDGSIEIAFTVDWPSDLPEGAYPGTNQCVAALVRPGETISAKPFTLSVPPGRFEASPGSAGSLSLSSVEGATPVVQCEPFQSEGSMSRMVDSVIRQLGGSVRA